VGGDGGGERASAQEVLVVRPLDAIADAGAKPGGLELPALDPAADGLLVGADAAGDVGDGQQPVCTLRICGDGFG